MAADTGLAVGTLKAEAKASSGWGVAEPEGLYRGAGAVRLMSAVGGKWTPDESWSGR
jgi:hypothetical protein